MLPVLGVLLGAGRPSAPGTSADPSTSVGDLALWKNRKIVISLLYATALTHVVVKTQIALAYYLADQCREWYITVLSEDFF